MIDVTFTFYLIRKMTGRKDSY